MKYHFRIFYRLLKPIISIGLASLFCFQNHLLAAHSKVEIKAAYLYQFTKFSQWQESSDVVIIGIVSGKKMADKFDAINGKTFGNKEIRIKRVVEPVELKDCCSIVFFAIDRKDQFERYYSYISNRPVLTVLDLGYDNSHRGMIRFIRKGTKLKFSVDNTLTRSHSIKLSAFLLQVATKVD